MSLPSTAPDASDSAAKRAMKLLRVIDAHNVTLRFTVSPCSWMYGGHVLQISAEMIFHDQPPAKEAGQAQATGGNMIFAGTVPYATATEQDFLALCEGVHLCKCKNPGCERTAFDPAFHSKKDDDSNYGTTNREGECEACFMGRLRKAFDTDMEVEAKRELEADAKMLATGFRWKVSAWIHARGDDRLLHFYQAKEPAKAEIVALLKKHRSAVLDDYRITDLTATVPAELVEAAAAKIRATFIKEDRRMFALGYGYKITADIRVGGKDGNIVELEYYFFGVLRPDEETVKVLLTKSGCPTPEKFNLEVLADLLKVDPRPRAPRPLPAGMSVLALSVVACKAKGLKMSRR